MYSGNSVVLGRLYIITETAVMVNFDRSERIN